MNDKARFQARRKELLRGLKQGPCQDCLQTFPPECMDWDHRPGTGKRFNIMSRLQLSWESLMQEIAKCDLVCANCHRIRTSKRQ